MTPRLRADYPGGNRINEEGVESEGRTGDVHWITHEQTPITERISQQFADLVGLPLENDHIGRGYRDYRSADRRIAAALNKALGDARNILNVGAGVGSYELAGLDVVALEPSRVMLDQRISSATPLVQGGARKRVVMLSWVGYSNRFWLFDYFPEIETIDAAIFPDLEWLAEVTGCRVQASVVPVPGNPATVSC